MAQKVQKFCRNVVEFAALYKNNYIFSQKVEKKLFFFKYPIYDSVNIIENKKNLNKSFVNLL